MELIAALRRVRACENEVAAQLVFEHAIAEAVAAERAACAKVCDEQAEKDSAHQDAGNQPEDYRIGYMDSSGDCGHAVRARSNVKLRGSEAVPLE